MSNQNLRLVITILIVTWVASYIPAPVQAGPLEVDRAEIVGSAMPDAIPDEYIVVLKDAVSTQMAQSLETQALRLQGVNIHYTYSTVFKGFAATLPAQALKTLRQNQNIRYIEANQKAVLVDTQLNPSWGLDRIDQQFLPLNSRYFHTVTGKGVNVYVIDTGIRLSHAEFGGRAYSGFSSVADGLGTEDCNGHGTHVAGTIGGTTYGVAKAANLYAVRVLDCYGFGTYAGVIAGIDWVTANHRSPAVANMSLGGSASTAVDEAIQNSIASGVTYAVAAGNWNYDACYFSPARAPNALTVGATTLADARADFSNYGTCVDLFAPGVDIPSAWNTDDTATNVISGTSMAAPHVAGVAALYLQTHPAASPAQVNAAIVEGATHAALADIGPGSPNKLLYSPVAETPIKATVTYQTFSNWGTGFEAGVHITNRQSKPQANWVLEFDWPHTIDRIWDAQISSHTGDHYIIVGAPWNRTIAPSGTVNFGLLGALNGPLSVPANCRLNGQLCKFE